MAERSVVVLLKAEVSDFKRKIAEAAKAQQDATKAIGDAVTKNEQHINTLSNQAGALGLAMVAAAGLAVKAFADFDAQMSAVEAATHESTEGMAALRDAALDAGARTKFSATEAAGAVEELAKAGIETADILGGGLDGALDLAAAGSLDVSEAASIAAIALKQFNLEGEDVAHVADLLAAGAGKAMGDVSDLGMALRQSGQVANATGLSIEETTAALSAFASAGLLGSDAGTSFKAMLQRLTPQSAEAQAKFDELGISAYDASGNFVGLENLAGQLQTRMKNLTPEARNAALGVMFGSDAVRAATVLYDEGATGIAEWTEKVDDSGYAAETAAIKMDNLRGDVETLGGAIETALINAGESGDGTLRTLTQNATDVVNALSEMPPAAQTAALAIVGGGGLVLLSVAGLGKMATSVNEVRTAFSAMSTGAKFAGGAVTAALGAVTIAFMAYASAQAEARARSDEFLDTLDEFGQTTDATIESLNRTLAAPNQVNFWEQLFGEKGSRDTRSAFEIAEQLAIATDDVTLAILGQADAQDRVNAAMREAESGAFGIQASKDAAALSLIIEEQQRALESSTTEKQRAEAADRALGAQADDTAASVEAATDAIALQIPTLEDLIKLQMDAAGVVLSQRDAQRALEGAIDDAAAALTENGATLDINTEAGRANQTALDDIASSTWDLIDSMRENGATQESLQGQMQTSRDRFIESATAMGMGADEANRLADEMGLIPAKVNVDVAVETSAAERKVASLKALMASLTTEGVRVGVDVERTGYYANRNAAGGFITGPGTGTSDSIPSWLSNGEYVIKADTVSHYGKSFFDGLNAQRFATGGFVGAASTATPATASGPQVQVLVERVVQASPQEIGHEVAWAMAGRPR